MSELGGRGNIKPTPTKFCKFCGKKLERRRERNNELENNLQFKRRKYCGRNCMKQDFKSRWKEFKKPTKGGDGMESSELGNISKIEMNKEEAEKLFKAYEEAIANRKNVEEYLEQLKEAYGFLKEGKVVIDVWDAFKKTGVGEDGLPKLAISRANRKEVYLTSKKNFGHKADKSWHLAEADVILPAEVTREWKKFESGKVYKTNVPIVPAPFLPKGDLSEYYILWEVGAWEEITVPPRRDPFLLKRISKNLFAVIAAWDLTELEASLIRGR